MSMQDIDLKGIRTSLEELSARLNQLRGHL
jgi:hypothetical protein